MVQIWRVYEDKKKMSGRNSASDYVLLLCVDCTLDLVWKRYSRNCNDFTVSHSITKVEKKSIYICKADDRCFIMEHTFYILFLGNHTGKKS